MTGTDAEVTKSKKLKEGEVKISFLGVFRHGTFLENAATCLGVLLIFISGSGTSINFLIMGEMSTAFVERTNPPKDRLTTYLPILSKFGGGRGLLNATHKENMAALLEDAVAYVICTASLGCICVTIITLGVVLIHGSALRQITTIRMLFLKAVLRQDMSWFDMDRDFNLASQMSENLAKLKDGLGEKLASVSVCLGSALFSLCVTFPLGWELSLACIAVISFSVASAAALSNYQTKSASQEMESYSQAGKHAEEILKSIKTVVAFGGEPVESSRYSFLLQPAERYGRKRGLFNGLGTGFNWVLLYCVTATCITYGVRLVVQDRHKPAEEQKYVIGTVLGILFNVGVATQMLTMCIPFLEVFAAARSAAASIFQLIDRIPNIDSFDDKGIAPRRVLGDISIENICFSYPARPDIKILNNFSLQIKRGECVAFVGSSGCGKTTLLQLLQRLYDPLSGSVKLDGRDFRNLNLRWLRATFGVVGQEPVLFRGTIYENIAIGCPEATIEEVQRVASLANAHEFIKDLSKGYETFIGERGASLSGGQKQRIAIARALLRDPAVLLLDEPTSALDPHSEQQVQAALDRASVGRTTIVVSHRLATIVNAKRIICMDKGAIVEQGTHEELMKRQGFYHRLVTVTNGSNKETSVYEEITPQLGEAPEEQHSIETINECKGRRISRVSSTSTISVGHRSFTLNPDTKNEDEHEDVGEVTGWQIMKLNAPEWIYITIGSIAAFTQGSCFSVFGLLMAYFTAIFVLSDEAQLIYLANLYAGLFIAVAAVAGLCTCLQSVMFTVAGLKMTSRLRIQYFSALMRQEIGFFNKQSNTVGALCAQLSGDTADLQNATGLKVGIILQAVSSVIVGICMGLFFNWRLTLVLTAFLPFSVGSTWLEGRMTQRSQIHERNAMEAATGVATEAIISVRTVQSLGIERMFLEKFQSSLNEACAAIGHIAWVRGLVMSIGLYSPLVSCCACFFYGTTLIINGSIEYKVIVLVTESVVFGAYMLGHTLQYTSSFNKVNHSAARILSVINRKPLVQTQSGVQDKKDWSATGNFSLHRVEFAYPNRKKQKVLRGISLNVGVGKTVALVGPSGCGKTTILELLQRFYDPDAGTIDLDAINSKTALTLSQLRQQLGVVQQEPVLFNRSLAENIAYGDNSREVCMNEIIAACEAANIHTFIMSLPQGYDTNLGAGGAQLSGGQKQRVCIARALIRSPRLLLLDEATSALDAASERVVSEALDKAAKDRTCIMVAHRLSTVKNADLICVLHKGKIVEKGNHADLIKLQGLYYQMCKEQNIA